MTGDAPPLFADEHGSLIDDLNAVGYPIRRIDELKAWRYVDAVPVLIDWLTRLDGIEQEVVIRALTVPWAKPLALEPMLAVFSSMSPDESGKRWAAGNALDVLWSDSHFDDLARIAVDVGYGESRQMVVYGMRKSKDPRAVDLLIELLDDDDVVAHAISALVRLRAGKARRKLKQLLDHPRPYIRKEAQKALDRIPAAGRD
ncbi:hypothetical protein [Orlajensenia leifsoniae]|uniref:HEAT repeat domain-containing protein n=1 Tax=Orlajensenia leifsoniae TaxID=2561933 RepID=A0A4Y9QU47_9MICO|nr:hypothetical protein [Leifsonia flava]TFV95288.1 hypothetical protein E4M00_14640 [Leifsonia flava]